MSVTTASVVSTMAAIEAAFWSAERVTLAGSTMPALGHVGGLLGQSVIAETVVIVATDDCAMDSSWVRSKSRGGR
jgi:hypothetical protein